MANNTTSALFGDPPNTKRDYYIIRGMERSYGLSSADPNDGFTYFASEPAGYVHETKIASIMAGLVIMILAILIPTVTRLALRASIPAMSFGSDDWAIILAAVSYHNSYRVLSFSFSLGGKLKLTFSQFTGILYAIIHILVIVEGGGGLHIWEVTYEQYNSFVYWGSVASQLYYAGVGLIQMSITLFLRRIAHQAFLPWRIFCDVLVASLTVYVLYALFSTSLFCTPIKAGWSMFVRGELDEPATCIDTYNNAKALSIIHLVQGAILLASPVIMLWKVRMSLSKKIRLFAFWFIGGLAVLGALLAFCLQNLSTDYTWSYTSIITWAAIDICFGMLTASLPVLDAFIEDAWTSTKKKIATGRASRGGFCEESQPKQIFTGTWTDANPPVSQDKAIASRDHRSESQEHFVQEGEDTVEMSIMRTRDVEVRASTVYTPESLGERPSGS